MMNQTGSSVETAGSLGQFIAPKIGMSWDNDEENVLGVLDIVQDIIWKSGLFHGSTGIFTTKIHNGELVTPSGYNILLGINIDGKPKDIRDKAFIFHRNGPASIEQCNNACYNTNVYDLGESATMKSFNDLSSFGLVVKSSVKERIPNPRTTVSGNDSCGVPLVTYESDDKVCVCNEETPDTVESVQGVKYRINCEHSFYNNIRFSNITNIIKDKTFGHVTYYARFDNGDCELIALLGPNDTLSSYRHYQIPSDVKCSPCRCTLKNKRFHKGKCGGCGCDGLVEALFKKSKPSKIVSKNQLYIVNDRLSVLTLAKYANFIFNKDSPDEGQPYLVQGIGMLNAEIRATSANTQSPVQIDSHEQTIRGIND